MASDACAYRVVPSISLSTFYTTIPFMKAKHLSCSCLQVSCLLVGFLTSVVLAGSAYLLLACIQATYKSFL